MKRALDVVVAVVGLMLLSPILLLVCVLVKVDSRGPVFFRQERIGRGFKPFRIYKFRSMVQDAPQMGSLITCGDDPRITRIGKFLRKTKIDELPQLINVLKGEMSLVGPRPEIRQYVELFRQDYQEILKVRPGITDIASLKYRDESKLLGSLAKPSEEYVTRILPDKIRLGKEYVSRCSVVFDITLVFKTMLKLFDRSVL
jgi:lipopolysaccharide/colanic/teichoic acid biosynthesis glycosyltransferase